MTASPQRIPSLDGVRAIAIGLVIVCHLGGDLGVGDPFGLGNIGVRVFFVLSGFLITSLLLQEEDKHERVSLRRFYFRRSFRIFPPFYTYIFIMLVLSQFGLSNLTVSSVIPALTYTSNYWSAGAGYTLSNSWSLAVEEQFYLIWPPVLVLLSRHRAFWFLVAIIAVAPLIRFSFYRFSYFGSGTFEANMDALAVGCILAIGRGLFHAYPIYVRIVRSRVAGQAALALIVFINYQTNHPTFQNTLGITILNLCVGFLIDCAVTNSRSRVGRILNSAPFIYVGMLSYSLYIWQQPFLHLNETGPVLALAGSTRVIAVPPMSLLCVVLAACTSYYLVEKWSFVARDNLEKRLFGNGKSLLAPPSDPASPAEATTVELKGTETTPRNPAYEDDFEATSVRLTNGQLQRDAVT